MRKALPRSLPPLLLGPSLLAIYLRTLAPGLTWANGGSDGGDLISAAARGGVAHPTGYPLYLLLARLFQFVPVGSLAFRTNLMSAVWAALASVLVYEIVRGANAERRWWNSLAAGLAFGLAPLVWSQAVISEVYTLQAFLTALILYLYLVPGAVSDSQQKKLDIGRGLTLGLAMGNHLTTLLLVPAAMVLGSIARNPQGNETASLRNWRWSSGALLRQVGMFFLGLCIYLILPVRAAGHPPVNWGDVVTPSRLWWLVSGQLYQSYYLGFKLAAFWGHLRNSAALLIQQFGLPGLMLGLLGLIFFGRRSRLFALTGWTAAGSLTFSVLYLATDSYVYLIPLLLCFAIWIGLGLEGLAQQIGPRAAWLGAALSLIVAAYLVGRGFVNWSQVDASQDGRAEAFGREVLANVPRNAIVFAKGDEAVFALWYFHFALGERPDLAILAEDLLHFDWYQENLRATYPSLVVPGPFPWAATLASANPARPTCSMEYSDHVELNCSPPVKPP